MDDEYDEAKANREYYKEELGEEPTEGQFMISLFYYTKLILKIALLKTLVAEKEKFKQIRLKMNIK